MKVRFLPVLLALCTFALWPQGLVLCVAECGHVEFEVEGVPCCPGEGAPVESGDCENCLDVGSPEFRIASLVTVAPPAATHGVPADLPPETRLTLPPVPVFDPVDVLDCVVLLI